MHFYSPLWVDPREILCSDVHRIASREEGAATDGEGRR